MSTFDRVTKLQCCKRAIVRLQIVIYDEDGGCKANGDEETWYGDFGWRSLEAGFAAPPR